MAAHKITILDTTLRDGEQSPGISLTPAEPGLRMSLPLGRHSGRRGFSRACVEAGIPLGRNEFGVVFHRFRELADTRKYVTLSDVFEKLEAR